MNYPSFNQAAIDVLVSQTACELQGWFTSLELETIIKAMRGVDLIPEAAGAMLYAECVDLARFDWSMMKTRLHIPGFLQKAQALSAFQAAYLEAWGHAFWSSDYTMTEYTTILQKMDTLALQ